jgi:hypothetical protein
MTTVPSVEIPYSEISVPVLSIAKGYGAPPIDPRRLLSVSGESPGSTL